MGTVWNFDTHGNTIPIVAVSLVCTGISMLFVFVIFTHTLFLQRWCPPLPSPSSYHPNPVNPNSYDDNHKASNTTHGLKWATSHTTWPKWCLVSFGPGKFFFFFFHIQLYWLLILQVDTTTISPKRGPKSQVRTPPLLHLPCHRRPSKFFSSFSFIFNYTNYLFYRLILLP